MRYQQIELFGKPFLVDPDDSLGLVKWGEYEPFESQIIRNALHPESYFVDVGAHIGYYSCLARSCGARVTAYEPNPLNSAFLAINLSQYGWHSYGIRGSALSDEDGDKQLFLSPTNSGDDTLYPFDDLQRASIMITTSRLDDSVWMEYPDLIKIDIQGGEIKALRGMERVLSKKQVKTLAVEFFPDALRAAGDNPIDMLTILRGHGFTLWEIREGEKRLDEIGDAQSFCDRADLQRGYTNIWAVRE